jgi:type I restriction enzyme, S subunit
MSEWKTYKLGELIQGKKAHLQTGPFGTMLNASEYTKTGIPVIAVQDIGNNIFHTKKLNYISETTASRLQQYKVKIGDIIFGRKGDVGRRAIVTKNENDWMQGSDCIRLRLCDEIDSEFISYQLGSNGIKEWLHQHSHGATMPSLNQEILSLLPLIFPPLPEQRAIASILSSLDDKIDLLHRQNKTLEGMAEALFRQWFVEEADEGWEERPLSSIANFLNGLACQKIPPKNNFDKLPVLKIRELSTGFGPDCDWADSNVASEYIVESGDVIFSWSASLIVKIWDGERCVLNQHLFKVTSDGYPKWFYLMWCKFHLNEFISIANTHATTMGHIKRGDLDKAAVVVPPQNIIKEMSAIMNPIIDKQINNSRQVEILEKQRDSLLPKLMSGEVRVEN